MNAMSQGAIGIVVYNNNPEREIYYDQGFWGIPFMLTDYDDGIKIQDMFAAYIEDINDISDSDPEQIDGPIGVANTIASTPNPNTGYISDFSSYGATPDLEFKPEITAPGGGIYSTLNDNTYGLMSGTSMAAPHVSGGATLVLERINADENIVALGLSQKEKAVLAKNLLMNTAVPIKDMDNPGVYDSVRVQGAGSMNIRKAIETDVVVTDVNSGTAKVNLGEINKNNFSITLNVQNFGDEEAVYLLDTMLTTDYAAANKGGLPLNTLISTNVNAKISYKVGGMKLTGNQLVVKPHESVILAVEATSIDTSMIEKYYPNGYFIDGFVTFTAVNDDEQIVSTDLSVPVMAFVGDWSSADAFDTTIYSKELSFYGITGLVNEVGYFLGYSLGSSYDDDSDDYYSSKYASISPNNDGYSDRVIPVFSMTRNLINMTFSIEDTKGQVVEVLETVDSLPKTWYDSGNGPYYHYYDELYWDGFVNGSAVPEGQYNYVITGYLADGITLKTLKMPFSIDVTDPVINTIQYVKGSKTLKVSAVDNIGISEYILYNSANKIVGHSANGMFNLSGYDGSLKDLYVAVVDFAENVGVQPVIK